MTGVDQILSRMGLGEPSMEDRVQTQGKRSPQWKLLRRASPECDLVAFPNDHQLLDLDEAVNRNAPTTLDPAVA